MQTYRCLTPVCSLLPSTLKSVRESGPESLYLPAHWSRQGGAGFAAHYRFIELITIRIITLNAGWGAGRFSAQIARSNFSPERRWRGYWICQAWTLWHRNELHKVSWGWAQFAALIPICLQHGEICTTYWTNNKRRERGERGDWWGLVLMAPQSEGPEGHAGSSWGLVPYTVPVDAMKCVIILWCCLDVAKTLFFPAYRALTAPKGLCVCGLHKIYTRFLILPWGPRIPRHQKVVNYGEFWQDHISHGAIFRIAAEFRLK